MPFTTAQMDRWARVTYGARYCGYVARKSSRLHKSERHAIGFADGLHLRVLGCGTGKIRWQTMHVDVFGVSGVGVDLGDAGQAESRVERHRDHVILGNAVKRRRTLGRRGARLGAVLF